MSATVFVKTVKTYPIVNGNFATDARDAWDVAQHAERSVDLSPRLDYCNAVIVIDVVRSRVAEFVHVDVVSSAQRRYLRRSCFTDSLQCDLR